MVCTCVIWAGHFTSQYHYPSESILRWSSIPPNETTVCAPLTPRTRIHLLSLWNIYHFQVVQCFVIYFLCNSLFIRCLFNCNGINLMAMPLLSMQYKHGLTGSLADKRTCSLPETPWNLEITLLDFPLLYIKHCKT